MTKLPRTIRLDPSDTLIYDPVAAPGEWAVPGGFSFGEEVPETMPGKRRQAFRGGFLGLGSFGWSTLVEVAEASAAEREAAVAALAAHLRAEHGAPDDAAALDAAEQEIAFAETLCDHPPGTLIALTRSIEEGDLRERFRTLHRRESEHRHFATLPVFALQEEAPERPDLTRLGGAP
ncbi:hypothetical protein J4558_18980 [Leptolyngbya sp. 15MV]|nr:hypothetical protein J4558_18980 [Leptolyngbya sp. 15MV]